jgi:hypothetical protein
MGGPKQDTDRCDDEEIARRRDAVLGRMAATPPKPHKPMSKSATDASPGKTESEWLQGVRRLADEAATKSRVPFSADLPPLGPRS